MELKLRERPWLSYAAILCCTFLFVVSIAVNHGVEDWLLSPSVHTLLKMGGFSLLTVIREHQIWRIVTSNWLHGSLLHLAVNMLGLYLLAAKKLEMECGRLRLAAIYFLSGMFGSIAIGVTLPSSHSWDVCIGASGALFGLEGAILAEIVTNWRHYSDKTMVIRFGGIIDGPEMGRRGTVLSYAVLVVVSILVLSFFPHVGTAAHFGGLFWGILLGFVLMPKGNRETVLPLCEVRKGGEFTNLQRLGFLVSLLLLLLSFVFGIALMFSRSI